MRPHNTLYARHKFQSNVVELTHESQEYILKGKRKPKQKEIQIRGKIDSYNSGCPCALFYHKSVLYLIHGSNMKNVSIWFPFHHVVRFGLVWFETFSHSP